MFCTDSSFEDFNHQNVWFDLPCKPGTVTVAGHPSREVPPGTLNNILKPADLK